MSHLEKPIPMTKREPNTHMHVPCFHKVVRKLHMQPVTRKYSCSNYLSQLFLVCPLLSFASFSFLRFCFSNIRMLQECSKWVRVWENRERSNLKLKKNSELVLKIFFYYWGLHFLHFPLFFLQFPSHANLWPFISHFSYFLLFS